jgi:flagellar basal body-associated protein FliL
MRRHHLILILVIMLCILAMVPLLLFSTASRQETGGAVVNTVVETSPRGAPITVGVVLVNVASQYGWVTAGEYAETTINGSRVIVFDNLNPTANPGVTLDQVVSNLIERGARYVFVSSGYQPGPNESRADEKYTSAVFIMNLAARADVETLLPALASTASSTGAPAAEAVPTGQPEQATSTSNRGPVFILIIILTILFVVAVGMSSWWKNLRVLPDSKSGKRKRAMAGLHGKALAIEETARGRVTNFEVLGELPPLLHELSTYVNGDIHFDESFAIELNGTFLGQCGMGPSEAVNRYDREKIAAFEVWLFDKNDIRTVTTVLLSEHAYHDDTLRTRLQTKGDLLLAEPDAVTVLETKRLRMRVRVLEMQYGFSDTLPQRSFFEHLVIEIAAWKK